MPYKDREGHFCSREEAIRQGTFNPDAPALEPEEASEPREFGESQREESQPVYVDTGRGQAVEVQPGAPFTETLERLAQEAHYGGYFRVFLNGSEVINPEDSPETIEPGMRIAITSYDKVG